MQGVYQIKNIINGKKYIGSSVDIRTRWHHHRSGLNGGYHRNPHLQNAWNKYGKDNFVFMLLEGTENPVEREQHYLDNVVELGFDYNIGRYATSGMKGRKHTEETKRKISKANKGIVYSEEAKRKLSEALTGRTLSEEHKRKVSEALTGRKHTEETKRKISETKIINEKNRRERGVPHHAAKLTNEQVWDIHTLYATGNYTQAQLGRRFPVSRVNIGNIVRGDKWPHVYDKFQENSK